MYTTTLGAGIARVLLVAILQKVMYITYLVMIHATGYIYVYDGYSVGVFAARTIDSKSQLLISKLVHIKVMYLEQ